MGLRGLFRLEVLGGMLEKIVGGLGSHLVVLEQFFVQYIFFGLLKCKHLVNTTKHHRDKRFKIIE